MKIKTALTKSDCAAWRGRAVVIDVLRSSTTTAALLVRGKADLRLYGDKKAAALYKKNNPSVEFYSELDFGSKFKYKDNSPSVALKNGRAPALIITTAGTPAVMSLKNASAVYMGGFCNFSALVKLLKKSEEDILLVPSSLFGFKEHTEDPLCAAAFKRALQSGVSKADILSDIAGFKKTPRYAEFLNKRKTTGRADAALCLALDSVPAVPEIKVEDDHGVVRNALDRRAVVLFSGGMDSTTCLYWALERGYKCTALCVSYGQKHVKEIKVARALAKAKQVDFLEVNLPLPWLVGSSLVGGGALPNHELKEIGRSKVPSTYVPGRNLIFVSLGVSLAESIGARAVILGVNALDYSGYPDCRPEFYAHLSRAVAAATKDTAGGVEILTPIIKMSKTEIIKLGKALGVPFERTWSCYKGATKPCGVCDACKLRAAAFAKVK